MAEKRPIPVIGPDYQEPTSRRVGSFKVTRIPGTTVLGRHVKLILGIGAALIAFHDLVYRQTGGTDFPLYGVLSHAGSDMAALTISIAIAVFLIPEKS